VTKTGTLHISQGVSTLDGTTLARRGPGDPLQNATTFVQNAGFDDGDPITVTGTEGKVGDLPVIFIDSVVGAAAPVVSALLAAKLPVAKKAVKKAAPKPAARKAAKPPAAKRAASPAVKKKTASKKPAAGKRSKGK